MITNTGLLQGVQTFSPVSGKRTQNIIFSNNAIGAASIQIGSDAPFREVKLRIR
jgi:hypothetical protein